jgi:uncharacterized iron-regulated membrane protein
MQAPIVTADGRERRVHVDPGTARVLGSGEEPDLSSVLRGLHYYLFDPSGVVFYVVTSLGAVMLISLVTGLLAYKKFWRGFWRWPRFSQAPRTWWGDLHRLCGLWSCWFVLLIGVTSLWYLAERAEWLAWNHEPRALAAAEPTTTLQAPRPDGAAIDRWVALAGQHLPGLRVTAISLDDDQVLVQGQTAAWLVRDRANAVWIDPSASRVLALQQAGGMSAAERWVHTADPLHFGFFGGLVSKAVWVLFGSLLTLLGASGVVIFGLRSERAARQIVLRERTAAAG